MSKPDYQRSGADYEELASNNDLAAIARLAELADHGWRGVPKDPARALELLRRAAELGSAEAARRMGDRYYRGRGVPMSEPDALDWYRRAAAAGDVSAMANLIPLHRSDDPRLAEEGRRWLAEAARANEPYALNTLKNIGSGADDATLVDFARASLAETAAKVSASGDELHFTIENVDATLEQVNEIVGLWIESLLGRWPHVTFVTSVGGDDIDFPAPDVGGVPPGVLEESDTVDVTIRSGVRHLMLSLDKWDEGWAFALRSFAPHPAGDEQRAIVASLQTEIERAGVSVPA